MQSTEISRAVIETVAYFDVFDYPLTYPELYHYLWRSPNTTLEETIQTAKQLTQLVEQGGFVMFHDRTHLPAIRQQHYVESELKWNKRRWFIRLLSYLPGVEAIFIVNTFSYHNVRPDSDIDLLIIARSNAIWATRFYTTLLAKFANMRPKPHKTKDAVCLSFYATPTGLPKLATLRRDDNDALEAYWLAQAMPVYDPYGCAQPMANGKWLKTVLPNNQPVVQHRNRSIQQTWLHIICHTLGRVVLWNRLLKKLQLWVMPKPLKQLSGPLETGVVVFNDDILKFHTHDPRPALSDKWRQVIFRYSK